MTAGLGRDPQNTPKLLKKNAFRRFPEAKMANFATFCAMLINSVSY